MGGLTFTVGLDEMHRCATPGCEWDVVLTEEHCHRHGGGGFVDLRSDEWGHLEYIVFRGGEAIATTERDNDGPWGDAA